MKPLIGSPILVTLLLSSASAYGANEFLKELKIHSCSTKSCIYLETQGAQRSFLDSIYVFDKAKAKVVSLESSKSTNRDSKIYSGSTGYFDPIFNRVVMKGVAENQGDEIVLSLDNDVKITFY